MWGPWLLRPSRKSFRSYNFCEWSECCCFATRDFGNAWFFSSITSRAIIVTVWDFRWFSVLTPNYSWSIGLTNLIPPKISGNFASDPVQNYQQPKIFRRRKISGDSKKVGFPVITALRLENCLSFACYLLISMGLFYVKLKRYHPKL